MVAVSVLAMERFFALLALLAGSLAVALLAARLLPGAARLGDWCDRFGCGWPG